MPERDRTLNPAALQAFYDRLGKRLDSHGFYENPAHDVLVARGGFRDARSVFEFGCGTGKLAARLLEKELPEAADYLGCDLSPVMVGLASQRLAAYGKRARVTRADGRIRFECPDRAVDRVVATYVLDLLPETEIRAFFVEAYRVLNPGGVLCLASLDGGAGLPSRLVAALWAGLFRLRPALVGGCRPIRLAPFVDQRAWGLVHDQVVTPFGIPSEVLILERAADAPQGRKR